ncbi:MAG: energy-coupling factor transporter transmembrane protein EcfT [Anaerolineae bacterium]|nr:energy-coupling factor transporter transmembrane protein EcfT [Anaerolineae bacterium]
MKRHYGPRIMTYPGNSFLHRLHPLVKLLWLVAGTVFVFATQNAWVVTGALLLILLAFPLNRLPLRHARGAVFFLSSAAMLFLVQVLFNHTGSTVLRVGPVTITSGGLQAGLYVAARLLGVIGLGYLFVFTTKPNDLAYGLMQVGLPYRYGFALVTALRLAPVFEQEAQTVYQAQLARGIAYDRGGLKRFLTLARQFFLPLLISALGKVDALAVSMEGRCFGKYPNRTFLNEIQFATRDIVTLLMLGALVIVFSISSLV